MRRTLVTGAVVVVMAVGSGTSLAEELRPGTEAMAGDGYSSVVISNPGASAPDEAAPAVRRVGRSPPRGALPEHVVRQARLRNAGQPERCLATSTTRRDTPMTSGEFAEYALNTNFAREFEIPACGSEVEPSTTPAQVAEAFLRTVPLPVPRPEIAPDGQAITGLAAYLETNGSLTHTVGPEPTALGPIEVRATGAYWVDWGDGSPEAGPFAFEGEAYPRGRIWHHYRFTGNYTVTLRQRWSANWSLGGDAGTVGGLLTETTIPVEVFEVQAVIRR